MMNEGQAKQATPVEMIVPLKQGLKPTFSFVFKRHFFVEMIVPLKQGLKPSFSNPIRVFGTC